MGGVWERLIRSVRKVLGALLTQQIVTDEGLATVMVEVESIMNSHPLTPVVQDPDGEELLTPNHLLLMRASPNLPPGDFSSTDIYARKRWRQVQYLADRFWVRWKREYLQTMQSQQKWQVPQKNFAVDDVVLLYDEHTPRGKWPLGRVVETYPDKQGHV